MRLTTKTQYRDGFLEVRPGGRCEQEKSPGENDLPVDRRGLFRKELQRKEVQMQVLPNHTTPVNVIDPSGEHHPGPCHGFLCWCHIGIGKPAAIRTREPEPPTLQKKRGKHRPPPKAKGGGGASPWIRQSHISRGANRYCSLLACYVLQGGPRAGSTQFTLEEQLAYVNKHTHKWERRWTLRTLERYRQEAKRAGFVKTESCNRRASRRASRRIDDGEQRTKRGSWTRLILPDCDLGAQSTTGPPENGAWYETHQIGAQSTTGQVQQKTSHRAKSGGSGPPRNGPWPETGQRVAEVGPSLAEVGPKNGGSGPPHPKRLLRDLIRDSGETCAAAHTTRSASGLSADERIDRAWIRVASQSDPTPPENPHSTESKSSTSAPEDGTRSSTFSRCTHKWEPFNEPCDCQGKRGSEPGHWKCDKPHLVDAGYTPRVKGKRCSSCTARREEARAYA